MKYEIQGETLPVVICQLADGERMITEGGAMSWMSPNMKMETTSNGGIGKAFGRAVSGDTGHLAAMDATCNMDVQAVPGMKNMLFGGEGIFNTVITGPGRIWLQTMPISNVAGAIRPYIPTGK